MVFLGRFVALGALLPQKPLAVAASCWRNTPCTGPSTESFPGPWSDHIYSPPTRSLSPESILFASGDSSWYPAPASLKGNGSQLLFDFGKEVGGIVTVTYTAQGTGSLGLAFSEAKNWTGEWSDDSNGSFNPDGALYANVTTTSEGNYTMPDAKLRGGFRYLTLFSETSANQFSINVTDIVLEIAYQPTWSNLQAYQGYFQCNDDLLNRIWYSGAYTLQTNSVPAGTGRAWPILNSGWLNDENLDLGTSYPAIYVDGSKRDRTVWAGDLAIAVPSILVSTGDMDGVRNTLQVLYDDQSSSGALPFAGPAINIYDSDTYHMITLIGTYDYFLFTDDKDFLGSIYSRYLTAMSYITAKIDSTGMLQVTGVSDWGRLSQGGHNTEANMLLYRALTTGSQIATWQGDTASANTWIGLAATLKAAVNANNYDPAAGAFKDSDTDGSIHPEDGNSMALFFGVANSSYISSISQQLTTNWISIGAVAPELPNNIVGYVQSFEIKGHLVAHQATRALDLIRRSWGWYFNNPYGTASTCIEGYLSDGTFGYRSNAGYDNDASYTSHAHGWSTGPTDALTSYILGLTLTQPAGSQWQLAPQFGDLQFAEGGFTTPLGKFRASWTLTNEGYNITWDVPSGTVGVLVLPQTSGSTGVQPEVDLDGARQEGKYDSQTGLTTIETIGGSHVAGVMFS